MREPRAVVSSLVAVESSRVCSSNAQCPDGQVCARATRDLSSGRLFGCIDPNAPEHRCAILNGSTPQR